MPGCSAISGRRCGATCRNRRLATAAQAVIGANRLPAHLPPGLGDELPEGPGVYRFFGEDDVLLYIGRSHSLRTRVLRHFADEQGEAPEQKKARLTRRIDWLETAGDLGARLTEAQWIKSQKPLFNKRVKDAADSCTLLAGSGPGVEFAAIGELDGPELGDCFGVFHSQKDARKALADIARAQLAVSQGPGARAERGLVRRSSAGEVPGSVRRQGTPPAASARGS